MLKTTLPFGYSFVQVISELATSSAIMTIENINSIEAERKTRQNVQPTTCGLTDKTGLSQCAEANSGNKEDSKDCQSCCVHSMDCSGTGDSSSIDSQCCKNRNHRAIDMQYYDKDCSECQIVRRDPTPDELTMCLHALSYKVSTSKWLLLCACIIKLTPNSNDTILC